jgi:alanine racemase
LTDSGEGRWAWADIDLDAVAHNVRHVLDRVRPAAVRAVVKADGYGHGATPISRAALAAGADGLCVALVQEGIALREDGIDAPILVLSEQPPEQAGLVVAHGLTPTVYTPEGVEALVAAGARQLPVHVKLDSGMQRVGVRPDAVDDVLKAISEAAPALRIEGIFTHLAVADDPVDEFTDEQLTILDSVLAGSDSPRYVHAANSAGALAHPHARRSFVRLGIALYGLVPGPGVADLCHDLRPALSLCARVSLVKRVAAGSRISYGLRHTFTAETTVATVPIGYADGVPRRLSALGGEVLIGGRRRPMVGVVTMDQLMVDCGEDAVSPGDEVVLIGSQGAETITADEWAQRLGTINYEVVCGIGPRVPRRYHGLAS